MHPGPYLALVLLLVAAAASVHPAAAWRLWVIGGALMVIAAPGLIEVRRMGARLAAAAVFVAMLVLSVLWRAPASPVDAVALRIGPVAVQLSRSALAFAGVVAAKAVVAVLGLSAATAVLGERGLLVGLQCLRVPGFVVSALFLTMRYIHVSAAAASAARMAAAARGEPRAVSGRAAVAARVIGALVLRGIERSERIGWAMVSRGFGGRLPALAGASAPAVQWVGALCTGVAALVWAIAM